MGERFGGIGWYVIVWKDSVIGELALRGMYFVDVWSRMIGYLGAVSVLADQ